MGVSENSDTPKSSILIGFSIINHPFGVPLFLETSMLTIGWIFCPKLPLNSRRPGSSLGTCRSGASTSGGGLCVVGKPGWESMQG